jgi:hypothetical protein
MGAASPPLDPAALGLQLLRTHPTDWRPDALSGFKVALNVALDGCIVPTADGGRAAGPPGILRHDANTHNSQTGS